MLKGIAKIFILTLAIVAIKELLFFLNPGLPFGEKFYIILGFFFVQSIAINLLSKLAQESLEMPVTTVVLGAMAVRLITALMAVTIFILTGVSDLTNFTITFFTVYLFYFVFEIITVLSNLRSNLK